ncbi:class I SAM-dependent DNA methyltransferase [Cryptosporangium sp. NPDC048952]|uniref:class I SAM-dependent DNA methyltransferase n=1 Tax=Cryptosporangium sp. NPDC048952 TaxID=3363961 RepID=UPI00371E5823
MTTTSVSLTAFESSTGFRAVYESAGAYEQTLLPHIFDGRTDAQIVADLMREHYGSPGHATGLNVVDLGCGSGRLTEVLAPYARTILGVDSSAAMIDAFARRLPHAESRCQDSRAAVTELAAIRPGSADLIGAFWSLSYPIGDLYETLTADGVTPTADLPAARQAARRFLSDLLGLVAPGGHLLIVHFDAESPEQRLVTQLWERIAPFPESGRGYILGLIRDVLHAAEAAGRGRLRESRYGGVAVAEDLDAARRWFAQQHLKSLPALVNDPVPVDIVEAFLQRYRREDGQVLIPVGMRLLDFWATPPEAHLAGTGWRTR